ncbi:O-antigen polysaccharide polymerase Wzy family protein [Flavobacteriales bacterium]|nr:O-antigen polysaccharide polymerase Wzy family protein [Flavobacteriales bacterium]
MSLVVLKYLTVSLFATLVAVELLSKRKAKVLLIFLGFFGVYVMGKVILEIVFDFNSLGQVNFFISHSFTEATQRRILLNLNLFLVAAFISRAFPLAKTPLRMPRVRIGNKAHVVIVGSLLLVVGVYMFQRAGFVLTSGYNAFHQGGFGAKPFVIFVAEQLLWLMLFYRMERLNSVVKKRRILFFIIIPLLLLDLMTGKRGTGAIQLMTFLILFNELGYVHMSRKTSIFLIAVGMIGLDFVGDLRHSANRGSHGLQVSNAGLNFLNEQASTLNTLGYAIEYADRDEIREFSFRNFGADLFIWWDKILIKLGLSEPTSLKEKMSKFGYSGYIVTDAADGGLLDEGKSLGSSFITELWLLGGEMLVFFGSLLLVLCFRSISLESTDLLVEKLIFVPDLLYLARMSFGSVIVLNLFAVLLLGSSLLRRK